MAGEPIAGPYRLTFVIYVADWKQSVECFHLEHHYNRLQVCHHCFAVKDPDDECTYTNFRHDAVCFQRPRPHQQYALSGSADVSPLSSLLGFHVFAIVAELMHCGPAGVHLECGGCALLELCRNGQYGKHAEIGEWQPSLEAQLAEAYVQFRTWSKARGVRTSQPLFKTTTLRMTSKFAVSQLHVKAHTTLLVIDWLAELCCRCHSSNEYEQDRSLLLWGLSSMFHIWRSAGKWLTRSELRDARVARDVFFFSSWKLARLGSEVGTHYYKLLPKHHMIDHAERSCQATSWNPCAYWTFSDEDNMGLMSKTLSSVRQLFERSWAGAVGCAVLHALGRLKLQLILARHFHALAPDTGSTPLPRGNGLAMCYCISSPHGCFFGLTAVLELITLQGQLPSKLLRWVCVCLE